MKWRVEAQTLYTRTIEAETAEEAEEKMDELLQDCDHRDFDWSIGAHKTCTGCEYNKGYGSDWCYKYAFDRLLACRDYKIKGA